MISLLRIRSLLIIAAAALTTVTCCADEVTALDLMTYNIRTGKAMDGLDSWPLRSYRTLAVMHKHNPDVLGLQEAHGFQIDDLLTSMPGYVAVGAGRSDGRTSGELCAILYKPERLQLLRSDTFWLSDTPEVPNSTHWGNKVVRICTWAHFRDLKTQKYFYFFNTHLDHISQSSRVKSADLILNRIAEMQPKEDVVITGDFNAAEDNAVIAAFKRSGYVDTFRVIHPNEKIVGTTNAFQPERQANKIDYIFVDSQWDTLGAEIVAEKIDGRWPSDHLPVTARVRQK